MSPTRSVCCNPSGQMICTHLNQISTTTRTKTTRTTSRISFHFQQTYVYSYKKKIRNKDKNKVEIVYAWGSCDDLILSVIICCYQIRMTWILTKMLDHSILKLPIRPASQTPNHPLLFFFSFFLFCFVFTLHHHLTLDKQARHLLTVFQTPTPTTIKTLLNQNI